MGSAYSRILAEMQKEKGKKTAQPAKSVKKKGTKSDGRKK
jgi:hypothetical protein